MTTQQATEEAGELAQKLIDAIFDDDLPGGTPILRRLVYLAAIGILVESRVQPGAPEAP